MQGDSQSNILRGMDDLKKEIGKLRSENKKLAKRIERIECQGSQEQLNHLHDTLLETRQGLARLYILYMSNVIIGEAEKQKPETCLHFIAQLRTNTGHAQAEVGVSKEPNRVAEKFIKKACEDAEKAGIKLVEV